ncbi:T9SS type A sorting domain-containing protein [Lacinutrix sp. MEBiC02404]
MKKMYQLLFCLLFIHQIHAQYTLIPDPAFEQHLIDQGMDSEGTHDGQVLTIDIAVVNNLDISYSNISNLTGIQDFTALTSLKSVNNTNLISLDVSGLTALQDLDLALNYTLVSLNVTGCSGLVDLDIKISGLHSLDLSTCSSLATIDMYKSYLTDLDVHGLTTLTSIRANESYLQTLNVAGCTSLSSINIDETLVSTLDLSNNQALIGLGFYDSGIQNLNLSNCNNLESLFVNQSGSLSNLDLTNCTSIKNITFLDSFSNQITSFDTSNFPDLERIDLEGVSFTDLDLTSNVNLSYIGISNSAVSSLDLRNGNNTNITNFYVYSTNLSCISVDDENYATANWDIDINSSYVFSNDCQNLSTIENQINSISIYPNPVVNNLHIGLKNNQILQEVTIVDLQGKQLLTTTETTIDLSHLSTGYYFAMILTDQGRSVKKILKK